MAVNDQAKLVQNALQLGQAMFASPMWDGNEKKWHRCINVDTGQADKDPHYYYDVCNIYALARAMNISREMTRFHEGWLQAATWLFWLANQHQRIGYTSFKVATPRDQYCFALVPAALSEAYGRTQRPAFLSKARSFFEDYRKAFPTGKTSNVQASNHFILSAVSLYRTTGQADYLNHAFAEARHLLDNCRLNSGPAAGCFTDDQRITAFPRHVYATWALMELNHIQAEQRFCEACLQSMEWWQANQLDDGGFYFFFDSQSGRWVDTTVYSVHQKGMLLLSAWEIDRQSGGCFSGMIERAMACCDDPKWEIVSPEGWKLYRRSKQENSFVYSYELGWEILGHILGVGWEQ